MLWHERLLEYEQRALVKRFGLRVLALIVVEVS